MQLLAAAASPEVDASTFQFFGAFMFGLVIGWFLYFVNRYRGEVALGDLASVVGALGGAGILALFPAGTDLFAAYGVGLGVGFFGYLVVLLALVKRSAGFTVDYLIDGRRPPLREGQDRSAAHDRPMGSDRSPLPPGA